MTLTWIPDELTTRRELRRAEQYYSRSIRKVVGVLRGDAKQPCLDVVNRLQMNGRLLHPYVVEWYNRSRFNLESRDPSAIFACFDELDAVETRVSQSIERRGNSAGRGIPFDLQTRANRIPYAVDHLRDLTEEAYGSDEFNELALVEEPEEDLLEVVQDAWQTLNRYWPEAAAEVQSTTHVISFFINDFLVGGALQSYLGGIFLTRRRAKHGVQLAEEILHEASHSRLFYSMLDRELWTNPEDETYETVLRRDRRPFWGLFHQLFVLTRLVEYYRRVVEDRPEFDEQYQEIRDQAERAVATVDMVGQFTPQGRELFETLRAASEQSTKSARRAL